MQFCSLIFFIGFTAADPTDQGGTCAHCLGGRILGSSFYGWHNVEKSWILLAHLHRYQKGNMDLRRGIEVSLAISLKNLKIHHLIAINNRLYTPIIMRMIKFSKFMQLGSQRTITIKVFLPGFKM